MAEVDIEVSEEVARAVSDLAMRHYGDNSMASQQRVVEGALRWILDKVPLKITFNIKPEALPSANALWKRIGSVLLSDKGKNNKGTNRR